MKLLPCIRPQSQSKQLITHNSHVAITFGVISSLTGWYYSVQGPVVTWDVIRGGEDLGRVGGGKWANIRSHFIIQIDEALNNKGKSLSFENMF